MGICNRAAYNSFGVSCLSFSIILFYRAVILLQTTRQFFQEIVQHFYTPVNLACTIACFPLFPFVFCFCFSPLFFPQVLEGISPAVPDISAPNGSLLTWSGFSGSKTSSFSSFSPFPTVTLAEPPKPEHPGTRPHSINSSSSSSIQLLAAPSTMMSQRFLIVDWYMRRQDAVAYKADDMWGGWKTLWDKHGHGKSRSSISWSCLLASRDRLPRGRPKDQLTWCLPLYNNFQPCSSVKKSRCSSPLLISRSPSPNVHDFEKKKGKPGFRDKKARDAAVFTCGLKVLLVMRLKHACSFLWPRESVVENVKGVELTPCAVRRQLSVIPDVFLFSLSTPDGVLAEECHYIWNEVTGTFI